MQIREANPRDHADIHDLCRSAFDPSERDLVATLAVKLLAEDTKPPTFSWVAEQQGAVVGHVAFSPVTAADNGEVLGYILAPLAVRPDCQGQGIGSRLVEYGMQQLKQAGERMLFVYGDPDYYGRFGFSTEAAEAYRPPYPLQYAFGWQAIVLNEHCTAASPLKLACVTALRDPKLW